MDINGNFTFVNEEAFDMFGYTHEDFDSGLNALQMYIPEDFEQLRSYGRKIYDGEQVGLIECMAIKKDGTRFPVLVRANPIFKNNKPAGFRGIAIDISERTKVEAERKLLETQLFQSQKMEAIGRLAGGIAHDFNNILATIMGYSSMLKMEYDDPMTKVGKAVDSILRNTRRAEKLIGQILGFARAGKYNMTPLSINNLIMEIINVTGKIFEEKINVIYDLAKDVDTIEADKSQIDQVLTNLIINACDAMPGGGDIIFKTENVYLDEKEVRKYADLKQGKYVKCSIKDTGIGIADKYKDSVFDPFFTTKSHSKSSGFGLATAYGIIKNHYGHIEFESKSGEGSTFTFYLPASDEQVVAEQPVETLKKGDAIILIADDEEEFIDMLRDQLESLGYKILTANNGIEAVDIYKKNFDAIRLVLLDMIMPLMSGKEAFFELQKINPEVKVIIMSGFSRDENVNTLLNVGAEAFIQKPFDIYEISNLINMKVGN